MLLLRRGRISWQPKPDSDALVLGNVTQVSRTDIAQRLRSGTYGWKDGRLDAHLRPLQHVSEPRRSVEGNHAACFLIGCRLAIGQQRDRLPGPGVVNTTVVALQAVHHEGTRFARCDLGVDLKGAGGQVAGSGRSAHRTLPV
jgi:hypothetical protein